MRGTESSWVSMALFITFIPLPVEAKVKEEETHAAASASFLFFILHMRI